MELRLLMIALRLLDPRGFVRRLRLLAGGVVVLLAWWVRAVQVADSRVASRERRRRARRERVQRTTRARERDVAQGAAARVDPPA